MSLIYYSLLSYEIKHDLFELQNIITKRISLASCLIALIKPLILLATKVRVVPPIRIISVSIAIVVVVPKGWSLVLFNKVGLPL